MPKKKVIVLVSGGIDSPVAAALLAKKYEIVPLHFSHYPFYCKGSFERAMKVLASLKEKTGFKEVIIVPWAPVLKAVLEKGYRDYICVLCRAAMFRAAGQIAKKEGAIAIATGEALAQKASQTLANMAVTSIATDVQIFRPLLGMDKSEIEALSKRFGLWTTEHVGCCTATPEKPKTRAKALVLEKQWEKLGFDEIIKTVVSKMQKLKDLDKAEISYILEKLRK
ncbi:MAG: hypothetical protein QW751_00445 [Candidatus Aenigmatarchaeota archaeon]|nr:hypothetical protein [Candidatus Aenigmarchaeota archaeon]